MIERVSVDEVMPHPENKYYFDDIQGDAWNDLLQSIRTSGVTNAITIDERDYIISGHQRIRACKLLGIEEVPAHVIHYTEEELERRKDVKDLIESNLKQRVPGNSNPVKLGRCFAFLDEYYGVKEGRPKKVPNNSVVSKTQKELADESGISVDTIQNYKRIASAIPEIQDLVETGKVSPTTALSILRQLPEDEQKKLALAVAGTEEKVTNSQVQELINRLQTAERDLAEKDKKISELENREPIVEKIEVEPEDYKQLKRDLKKETKMVGALRQDLNIEKQRYDRQAKEKRKLEEKIEELQQKTVREEDKKDVNASALMFAAKCRNFLSSVGGYAFIAEYLSEMDKRERDGYIHAAKSVRDWVTILLETIERNENELFGSYK